MWIPSAAAFRAGYAVADEGDIVGAYSVAMGYQSKATGQATTVAGGSNNAADGDAYATISGGNNNIAQGFASVISGGRQNTVTATGDYSVIPGGQLNEVDSQYSFAGGMNNLLTVNALHSFVWGWSAGQTTVDKPDVFIIDPSSHGYRVGIGNNDPKASLDVNGGGPFRSSLTVTGAGLTGTQTALEVIGSTLVVRNDGNIGMGTASPQATLDVNGNAQFGAGVNKSTFTAEGFWQPRWVAGATLATITPSAVGQIVGNFTSMDLCVSTDTTVGSWAALGAAGANPCY
jgi:hypothetical protein